MTLLSRTTGRPLDVITLRELSVHCVIGVHPEEKIRTQALNIDVKLFLDARPAALSGILARTVDYSLVAKQISFILTHSRFRLLESAAEALAVFLLSPLDPEGDLIQAVEIEIHKPEALQGLAIPSIRIFREQADRASWIKTASPFGILFQVPEAVMERRLVPAGGELFCDESDDLALMTESSGLMLGGNVLTIGSCFKSTQRIVLANPLDEDRSVLAVTFRGRERFPLAQDRLH